MLNSAAILESKLKLVDGVHDTVGMLIASTNDDTIEGIGETPAPSCGKISLDWNIKMTIKFKTIES